MNASLRFILAACFCACLALSCEKYDDSELRNGLSSLTSRVTALESWKNTAQGNIQSLLTLTEGLNKNYFITAINKLDDGYEFVFSNGSKAVIKDGHSPAIGVKKDSDGEYYWTLDGAWLQDADKNKIRATGDAPQLKIEDGFWFVSTNKGASWTKLGQATGDKGDSMFREVTYDASFVYFVLADGTSLKFGRGVNGVQTLAVVPDLEDGGVLGVLNDFTIRFDVLPASSAEALASLDPSRFHVNLVYTRTKAQVGDELTLPITGITGSNGRITVTVNGSALCEDFAVGKLAASASLSIDDGTNAVTSGYFPVRYDAERIKKLIENQWISTEIVPTPVRDIGYSFPGYYFYTDKTDILAGINPSNAVKGPYLIYQLPNGIIKLFADNYQYWYMFRVVSETEIEQCVYSKQYEAPYTEQDEYGWHSSNWVLLALNDAPQKLYWKSMGIGANGSYYTLYEAESAPTVPSFETHLSGLEKTLPMVRMNNAGTVADFASVTVTGKIVVLNRGEISFAEKLNNAYAAGAAGVLCANNSPDTTPYANLSGVNPAVNIPFAMISQEAGQMLAGHTSLSFIFCSDPSALKP